MRVPPTSVLLDPHPQGVYRVISLHAPPMGTIVDLCCGEARWTHHLERAGGYRVVRCDVRRGSRAHVLCDLRAPPFRRGVFDVVMADLPYPFYRGKSYRVRLKSVDEYVGLLDDVGETANKLLRPRGVLAVKTYDFWRSDEMTPGLWAVHDSLSWQGFVAVDVVVLFLKSLIYPPGHYRRALRAHEYLAIYRKGEGDPRPGR